MSAGRAVERPRDERLEIRVGAGGSAVRGAGAGRVERGVRAGRRNEHHEERGERGECGGARGRWHQTEGAWPGMIWPAPPEGLAEGPPSAGGTLQRHYSRAGAFWHLVPRVPEWCVDAPNHRRRRFGTSGPYPVRGSQPLVLALRRNATSREPPGASVTDRGTAFVHPMTVRAAGISGPITSRVTTDHRPAGPASDTADLIEHHSPAQSIASRIIPGGDRRVSGPMSASRSRSSARRASAGVARLGPSLVLAHRVRPPHDAAPVEIGLDDSGRPRRAPGRG